jgi:transposase
VVVNPADVATTNKERQYKTDRVDAHKLARELSNCTLRAIYVPDRQAQEDRSLVRLRASFVRKQTRAKNQIRALLEYYGIHPKEVAGSPERHWSGAYIQWLQNVPFCHPSGRAAMDALLGELLSLRETIAHLTRQIRLLASQDRYRDRIELLCSVPGVSLLIAMTLLTELVTIDRFDGLDTLASFVGLVPGERSSGNRQVVTGITRRHNKVLRAMIVESAWVAIRHDPALMMAFLRLSSRMPKQCAIVRIARKLLNRMRSVLMSRTAYQLRTV